MQCRVYTPDDPESSFREVRGAMDLFIFAHFFGWICKALLWRDWTICWMVRAPPPPRSRS